MPIVKCEVCSKNISLTPNRFKNKHHTCSKKCMGILSSKLQSKKITTSCEVCNKEIAYKKNRFKQIKHYTCSKECRSHLMKTIYKSAGNPRFKNQSKVDSWFSDKCKDYERRAFMKKIEFNLDIEFLKDLYYNKQQETCHYSNIKMEMKSNPARNNQAASFNVASLDRIDSSKGYTKDNVVWCLNCVNMLKAHHNINDIITVMAAIGIKQNKNCILKIKKLTPTAKMPISNSIFNSGMDLFSDRIEDCGQHIKVYTGLAIQPGSKYYTMLAPRSSIYKYGLIQHNSIGVIDQNYTGEIIGIFYKTPEYKGLPEIGSRLMQLIPQELIHIETIVVDELDETDRGSGSFGSSGK